VRKECLYPAKHVWTLQVDVLWNYFNIYLLREDKVTSHLKHSGPNSWGSSSDINLLTPENEFGRAVACPSTHKWVFFLEDLNHAQSLANCVQKCICHSLFLFYQSQQKQMQEILKHLSQQDEKNKESQQLLGQHLNNEAQKQNCLIEQLRQMVAEREAKVKELEEEIGQLALQVEEMNYKSTLVIISDLLFHFLL